MGKINKKAVVLLAKANKKEKLSPAERSQIAKDRWAKRRAAVAEKNAENAKNITVTWPEPNVYTVTSDAPITTTSTVTITNYPIITEETPQVAEVPPVQEPAPAPPAPPKKKKRYTGPKEFSVALKAAESRLAKAIEERAKAAGQLAALQAEIPSLIGIIQALKGAGNYVPPPVPYDIYGATPNVQMVNASQPPHNPLAAIQAAMDAAQANIPVSRATGGVMLTPDVVGSLEGPDDDEDIDKFITGSGADDRGWIGG